LNIRKSAQPSLSITSGWSYNRSAVASFVKGDPGNYMARALETDRNRRNNNSSRQIAKLGVKQ
jgi:hypothetical protein